MPQSAFRNQILKALLVSDFALLQPAMRHVELDIKVR
ncbi:cyclic nucleotide-binding protein, partial [Mesorhizobium helmanticense]